MPARLIGLIVVSVLAVGAAALPGFSDPPAVRELRAASRLARDGDLQADWNKLLDARVRLERLVHKKEVAALAHYHLGYLDWRASSLVFMSVGKSGQAAYLRRGITELEQAVRLRPEMTDAHALIAFMSGALIASNPKDAEQLTPRIKSAWKAALDQTPANPRVLLLRAMVMFFAPPAFGGDQERGFQHWQDAIALLEKSNTADPLEPEWGLAEAWGWLGGAYLMRGDTAKAVPAFERALDVRRDFWWVSKIALPQAKRPGATAAQPPRAPQQQEADAPLYSVLLRWAGAVWTAVTTVVQTILAVRASL